MHDQFASVFSFVFCIRKTQQSEGDYMLPRLTNASKQKQHNLVCRLFVLVSSAQQLRRRECHITPAGSAADPAIGSS